MIIEALKPLRVAFSDPGQAPIHLKPGYPVNLPDDQARRLLEKAPGKVRLISEAKPGDTVEWLSPLFGRLTGELLAIQDNGDLAVFHPCTDALAMIAPAWVCATSQAGG